MPQLIKIDLCNLQNIVEILKARDLDKKEVLIADDGSSIAFTPVISAEESRKRLNLLTNIEIDFNSLDLDSEWWLETIKNERVNKQINVNFENS